MSAAFCLVNADYHQHTGHRTDCTQVRRRLRTVSNPAGKCQCWDDKKTGCQSADTCSALTGKREQAFTRSIQILSYTHIPEAHASTNTHTHTHTHTQTEAVYQRALEKSADARTAHLIPQHPPPHTHTHTHTHTNPSLPLPHSLSLPLSGTKHFFGLVI